ncbi:MAG: BON domain-containing protein [Chitinispirillaceae bacterium]
MPRSREDVKSEIEYRIAGDTRIDDGNVKVQVADGKVVLGGIVHSFSAKDAVEQDAWAVKGVNYIENRLSVQYPQGYRRPTDEAISENLQRLFSVDPDLYQENINLFVREGEVSLEGTVSHFYMKLRAENLTRQVGGIQKVSNKLAVVPSRSVSDEALGSAIEDHLHHTFELDANRVEVRVQNGSVVLAGNVKDRRAFDTVEDIARYTDGVKEVKNNLFIAEG